MGTRKSTTRPIAESHNFRGSLSSEPDEGILPGWLNAARGTKSYKRVIRILDLIRACEESRNAIVAKRAFVHSGPGKRPKEHSKLWRMSSKIHAELHSALRKYTFNMRLSGVIFGQPWILSISCYKGKDEFSWEAPYAYKALPGQTILTVPTFLVSEGDAVLALARLAERRLLSRVRLCATCSSKWFFAQHSNYRFCSKECREKHFTSGDEYRMKKALQMRVYRSKLRLKEEAENRSYLTQ